MDWNWAGPRESDAGWADAVAAIDPGTTAPWVLVADQLPAMSDQPIAAGRVVRSDTPDLAAFPSKRVTIPANTETRLLIDQGVVQDNVAVILRLVCLSAQSSRREASKPFSGVRPSNSAAKRRTYISAQTPDKDG